MSLYTVPCTNLYIRIHENSVILMYAQPCTVHHQKYTCVMYTYTHRTMAKQLMNVDSLWHQQQIPTYSIEYTHTNRTTSHAGSDDLNPVRQALEVWVIQKYVYLLYIRSGLAQKYLRYIAALNYMYCVEWMYSVCTCSYGSYFMSL